MLELANSYASLSIGFSKIPESLQPVFTAAIQAIEEYAAQQPGYDSMYEACSDDLISRLGVGETVRRRDYADPLVATIALYHLVGPVSWTEFGPSRARVK